MMACRGAWWLGWAALLVSAAVGTVLGQADGSLRWAFTAGNVGSTFIVSSPTVSDNGTVYFGVEQNTNPPKGYVFAVNRDGSLKWRFEVPDWVDSSPALGRDGTLYFGCWDGKLYALDANSGRKKWDYYAGTYVLSSPAVGPDGTIYVGGGDSMLHAVTSAGNRLWTFQTGSQFIESSPAVGPDGTVYFGSNDRSVYAVTSRGELKWRFSASSSVTSSPAIGADGTVYVGSFDGNIYALEPGAGVARWSFPTKGRVTASPILGPEGTIYCGSEDSFLYAINPDGSQRWNISVGKPIVSTAALRSDGTLLVGSDDGLIRALYTSDDRAGILKWFYKTGDIVESSPVVAADGTIYVGSLDGKMYSLNGSGAGLSDYSRWPSFRRSAERTGAATALATGGRLTNLSTRAVKTSSGALIAGLVTGGNGAKNYLIRAVGPSLTQVGVNAPLADPNLRLQPHSSEADLFSNDNWGVATNSAEIRAASARVGAFPLIEGSKDAAVFGSLPPGAYTAVVTGAASDSGVVLVEAYDGAVESANARLLNLSARAHVGTGGDVLIPGFVVGGSEPLRLLIRAVGPGLAGFGVPGALARPTMTVFEGNSVLLSNTGWTNAVNRGDIAGAAVVAGAFPLVEGSADCAALLTLGAGNYTIQVSGVGSTTGEALVEVYVLP